METNSRLSQADSRPAHVFTFGSFDVNLRTGELRKHGIRLSLQEQPLRILAALVERPGEVVSRQDLCRRLWPTGTFVDFEHSLNAAVRRLRVTLGDEAETPRFIETVHRRGYRFLAWGVSSGTKPVSTSLAGLAPSAPQRGCRAGDPASPIRLAVLPFVSFARGNNQGDQRDPDAFGDGLTEETITQLAKTCPRHIGVIARTSVMRLLGSEQTAAEARRVLGADYVVEGSIRREGDRVRIVAQLIESHEETHLWAETFDRVMSDALTVQTDVAQQIARAVAEALTEKKTAVGF
jgi:TolB-like protein/DNA-binding winged helix-turn-helix (wHTH) protein